MNADLLLWNFDDFRPYGLDEARRRLAVLRLERPGRCVQFGWFAASLQAAPTGLDPAWAADCVATADTFDGAVWALSLPQSDLLRALAAVVEHATAAGLGVMSEPLGMVFHPDGRVLPPEKRAQWHALVARAGSPEAAGRRDTRILMTDALQRRLASHGFTRVLATGGLEARFERAWADGVQAVTLGIRTTHGIDHATLGCHHVDRRVETIFETIFGTELSPKDSFWFHPGVFADQPWGHVDVSTDAQIRAELDTVEQFGLPVLDLAREPGGLDRVWNDRSRFPFTHEGLNPAGPRTLADHQLEYGKVHCLRALIAAHLAGNPGFDARVAELRRFAQPRADLTDADITKVVEHLRSLGSHPAGGSR